MEGMRQTGELEESLQSIIFVAVIKYLTFKTYLRISCACIAFQMILSTLHIDQNMYAMVVLI